MGINKPDDELDLTILAREICFRATMEGAALSAESHILPLLKAAYALGAGWGGYESPHDLPWGRGEHDWNLLDEVKKRVEKRSRTTPSI